MNGCKLIFVVLLLNNTFLRAQINDSDKPVVEKIKQANTQYGTITSQFEQTKHISILGEDVRSAGKFYYLKPDRLALRYENPAGDLMLLKGEQFVMVNAGKRKETSAKANAQMREMKTILSACLQGDVLQIGADKISLEETSEFYVVTAELPRKSNRSNISKAVMHYEKTTLSLSVLRTEEKDGSYTEYKLTGKEFDKYIDENIFQSSKKSSK